MKTRFYYPTYDEVLAIERAARGARAAEIGRWAALAVSKLKALTNHFTAVLSRALGQPTAPAAHREPVQAGKRTVSASTIDGIAAALPPDIRARYASELTAAARVEPWINFGLAAWDFTVRVLAHAFQGAARGLRGAAWSLDLVARRLRPVH
jgi:hypothetical protein